MTSPEPEDTRPDTDRSDAAASPPESGAPSPRRPDLPADVDAAFAAIVADWASVDAPRWPDDERDGPADGERSAGVGLATPPAGAPRVGASGGTAPAGPPTGPERPPTTPDDPEDEHFVPPEPPPLPRVGLSSLVGLVLLVAGVVLLAVPGFVGDSIGLGIVPGLLAMTAGLGWLVFGLRRSSDRDGDGPDRGGVV